MAAEDTPHWLLQLLQGDHWLNSPCLTSGEVARQDNQNISLLALTVYLRKLIKKWPCWSDNMRKYCVLSLYILYGISLSINFLVKINHPFHHLKIFDLYYFHESTPPGPLINRLKWFCLKIHFRKDIWIWSSKILTLRGVILRGVEHFW